MRRIFRASLQRCGLGSRLDAGIPLGRPILLPLDSRLLPLPALCSSRGLSSAPQTGFSCHSISLNQRNSAAKQAAMNPDGPPKGGADPLAKTEHSLNASNVSKAASKLSVSAASQTECLCQSPATVRQNSPADGSQATSEGLLGYGLRTTGPFSGSKVSGILHFQLVASSCWLSTIVAGVISVLLILANSRRATLALAQHYSCSFDSGWFGSLLSW